MSGLDSSQDVTDQVVKHASKFDLNSRPEDDLELDDEVATTSPPAGEEPDTP